VTLRTVALNLCERCISGQESRSPHGQEWCQTEGCALENERTPYLSLEPKLVRLAPADLLSVEALTAALQPFLPPNPGPLPIERIKGDVMAEREKLADFLERQR
jgi:hypothetical protein